MKKGLLFLLLPVQMLFAQAPFQVTLVEDTFPGWAGIHSFAYGQTNGKWVFIGGRKNGLHGFLGGFGFPQSGINNRIWVVDPATHQVWSETADSLPFGIRDAVTSSNMQFFQDGNTLYMSGGYGWSDSLLRFTTFPVLTAIDLPGIVNDVQGANPHMASRFRQATDTLLKVCGAHIKKIGNVWYQVWGHDFDGIYSVNDSAGFFIQEYAREIRRFTVQDNGTTLSITHLPAWRDSLNFRRRDFNLVETILPDRSEGLTAFTGVFRQGINLPYMNSWSIADTGYSQIPGFTQYLNQYHSAVMPLYDSVANAMHTVFFGGMGQYVMDANGNLVGDTLVPFVKTISLVTRNGSGLWDESKIGMMPVYTGSNAQFIPADSAHMYRPGILSLNPPLDGSHVGWIVGGIESPDSNIADTDPSVSFPSPRIFRVYVDNLLTSRTEPVKPMVPLKVTVFPNPADEKVTFRIHSDRLCENVTVEVYDGIGGLVEEVWKGDADGNVEVRWRPGRKSSGLYHCKVRCGNFSVTESFLVQH